MHTETLFKNSDGSTAVLDSQKFFVHSANGQECVRNQLEVFDAIGKSFRVDQYRASVENLITAVKFS